MTGRCLIIKKDNLYLVGVPYTDTQYTRWSMSKFDGVRFAMFEETIARKVADRVGGRVVTFDTLTGVVT